MSTPTTLVIGWWRHRAKHALQARIDGNPAAAGWELQLMRGGCQPGPYARRAEHVALLVWVDAILEACGLDTAPTGRPVRLKVYDIAADPGQQPDAIAWILRLCVARAAADHDATHRIIREAEVDPERWSEYLDQALAAAAITVQLEPAARTQRAASRARS